MQHILDSWVAVAVILPVTALIVTIIYAMRRRSQRRTNELELVAIALRAHYASISELINDPAIPDEAKEGLALFSQGIARREVAELFAADFARGVVFGRKVSKPQYWDDLTRLFKTRPDLAALYQKAVMSGLVILFLRWPGNEGLYQRMTVELAAQPQKSGAVVRKLSDFVQTLFDKDKGRNGDHRHGSLFPV